MRKLKNILILFLSIAIASCGKKESSILEFNNVKISAEGPLFEGSTTAQGEIETKLKDFAQANGIDEDKIESAKLKSVAVAVKDSTDFNIYSSLTIQFASEKTEMVKAAVINPIPTGSKKLTLTVAGEQDNLIDLLKQDKFTIVADAIVSKDTSMNIEMTGNFAFELTYKK
jgi:hypothetical protein